MHICDQPWDFQAYGGTWGKMSFLHFPWDYIDTKRPAELFCLILLNTSKGIIRYVIPESAFTCMLFISERKFIIEISSRKTTIAVMIHYWLYFYCVEFGNNTAQFDIRISRNIPNKAMILYLMFYMFHWTVWKEIITN